MKNHKKGRKNKRQNGCGYAVLFFGMFHDKYHYRNMVWEPLHVSTLKKVKPNINSSKNAHCVSSGYYASFGNKSNYAIVNTSSVAQYANKKSSSVSKQSILDKDALPLDNMISLELDNSLKSFGKYLRHINNLLSPVIDVAYKLQEELCSINLKMLAPAKVDCGYHKHVLMLQQKFNTLRMIVLIPL